MIKSKKLVAGLAALSIACVSFADVEFSFKNELSSDIVNITSVKDENDAVSTATSFAGIRNKTVVDFKSEKVDAGLDIRFWFLPVDSQKTVGGNLEDYTFVEFFGYDVHDYYIEYRPFNILTFGFHDTINTNGSYLPVWDDNVSTGNLGSDFVVCLRPIEGLRIATGIDFISTIGVDENDNSYNQNFIWNSGIDYTMEDVFSVGFTARDVLSDDRAFGFYGSLDMVDGLSMTAGFGINAEEVGEYEVSGNVLTFGATYENEDSNMAFGLDFATNFSNEESEKDLYLGANWGWGINDDWSLSTELLMAWDLNKADAGDYIVHPFASWTHEIHTIEAGVQFEFNDSEFGVCFPVKYTVEF